MQDNSTAQDYYLQILNSTAYWTTTPKTITFICKIGGGTENKTLSSDIKVEMLAKDGTVLSTTTVTGQITTAAGDDYAISVTAVNNVAGFRLYHTKTASYNVRFYSASLAYEVGSTETTDYEKQEILPYNGVYPVFFSMTVFLTRRSTAFHISLFQRPFAKNKFIKFTTYMPFRSNEKTRAKLHYFLNMCKYFRINGII